MTALRLALLALFGLALFNAPLLSLAAAQGPAVEVAYLFGVWALLVGAAAVVAWRSAQTG
jgi:hypothetical protein